MILEVADIRIQPGRQAEFEPAIRRGLDTVVSRAKGFRDGARASGSSASGISEAVRRLETQLGVRLLNRTTRKVAVTPAGADYLAHCRRVFDEMTAAEETLRPNHQRGDENGDDYERGDRASGREIHGGVPFSESGAARNEVRRRSPWLSRRRG